MFLIYALLFVLSAAYLSLKYVFTYWRRKGFPYIEPSIPFGNIGPVALRKQSLGMNLYDLYNQTSEGVVGLYLLFRPALMVRDADMVKAVLATDFAHFHDRGIYGGDPNIDPIESNIFNMKGKIWRTLRTKLTPAFTTGKLKSMMPIVIGIAENLERKLDSLVESNEIVEMKDLLMRWIQHLFRQKHRWIIIIINCDYSMFSSFYRRYALDIVGTVSFGLDVNTIEDGTHLFRTIEKKVNNGEFINSIRTVGAFLCPE